MGESVCLISKTEPPICLNLKAEKKSKHIHIAPQTSQCNMQENCLFKEGEGNATRMFVLEMLKPQEKQTYPSLMEQWIPMKEKLNVWASPSFLRQILPLFCKCKYYQIKKRAGLADV